MLSWSLATFIMAIAAAVLGFGMDNWASPFMRLAFFVFLLAFVVTLVAGLMVPRPPSSL